MELFVFSAAARILSPSSSPSERYLMLTWVRSDFMRENTATRFTSG